MCDNTVIETEEYKGYEIEIHYDNSPEDPRDWDNLGTIVCWHRRYSLGDDHNFDSPEDFKSEIKPKDAVILSVYVYEHGNIIMNTTGYHCPWDSGQVGFVYITKEKIRKEYNWKRITKKRKEKIESYLRSEIDTYSKYLSGEVYGYVIDNYEINESCWGYYGMEYAYEAAKMEIDYHEEQKEKLINHESSCIPFIAYQ